MANVTKASLKSKLRQSNANYFDDLADSIVSLSDTQTITGNKQKAQKDINTYVTNYLKGYYRRKGTDPNIHGEWIQISNF